MRGASLLRCSYDDHCLQVPRKRTNVSSLPNCLDSPPLLRSYPGGIIYLGYETSMLVELNLRDRDRDNSNSVRTPDHW